MGWVDDLGGWVVVDRALAVEVLRDADRFTVDDPRFTTGRVVGRSMLSTDGEEHARHRGPFGHLVRRRSALPLEHAVDEAAAELVASLPTQPSELRSSLAGPLAVVVTARLLGLAPDVDRLRALYDGIAAAVTALSAGITADAAAEMEALRRLVDEAGTRPGLLADAADTLAPAEVVADAAVMLFGGIETSEALTATALRAALGRPDWWSRLAAGDTIWAGGIVEEALRFDPAAARVDRYATVDTELGGRVVAAGDLVMVSLSAANRDPAAFGTPHEFRPDRPDVDRHLAFAAGPHLCVGLHLARRQSVVALTELAAARPHWRLDEARTSPIAGLVFRRPDEVWSRPA